MAGEIFGTGGIGTGSHSCQAVALEDTEVYVLPFERLEALTGRTAVSNTIYTGCSRVRLRASARPCCCRERCAPSSGSPLSFSTCLSATRRRFSSCEFVLRMTREEIGGYLGLTLETVSRLFSRFQGEGPLQVEERVVKLLRSGFDDEAR